MNKSVILSYQLAMHTLPKNDTTFQLNMTKNITQDFGKYNIMLNYFVMFYSDLGDQPLFSIFLASSGMH